MESARRETMMATRIASLRLSCSAKAAASRTADLQQKSN